MAKVHSEKVPEALQKYWALNGARMIEKETYMGHDVFYADGGPHYDAKYSKNLSDDDQWMKEGYYVSVFGLKKGAAIIGYPLYFKINHDADIINPKKRQKLRINAAKAEAKAAINAMISVGLLERYHGDLIIPVH